MYNEAIKHDFIESIQNSGTKLYAKSLFRRISSIESDCNKDIAGMSKEEIINELSHMHLLNYASVRSTLSIIKRYVTWYNLNVQNIFLENILSISATDVDLSLSLREEVIKDEDELRAIMSFASASDGYFEVPIILLAWTGFTLSEILGLRNEDVVVRDNTAYVQTERKTTLIDSQYIVNALKEYKSVKSSIRMHRGDWIVYPDNIGYFVKNMITKDSKFAGRPLTADIVRKKIDMYNRMTPDGIKKISVDNTLLSGRLSRILESEIATGGISSEVVVNEMRIRMPLLNDYIALYDSYKRAFDIKIENAAD